MKTSYHNSSHLKTKKKCDPAKEYSSEKKSTHAYKRRCRSETKGWRCSLAVSLSNDLKNRRMKERKKRRLISKLRVESLSRRKSTYRRRLDWLDRKHAVQVMSAARSLKIPHFFSHACSYHSTVSCRREFRNVVRWQRRPCLCSPSSCGLCFGKSPLSDCQL